MYNIDNQLYCIEQFNLQPRFALQLQSDSLILNLKLFDNCNIYYYKNAQVKFDFVLSTVQTSSSLFSIFVIYHHLPFFSPFLYFLPISLYLALHFPPHPPYVIHLPLFSWLSSLPSSLHPAF